MLSLTPKLIHDTDGQMCVNGLKNEWNVDETVLTLKHPLEDEVEEDVILIPDDDQDREIDAHENSDEAKRYLMK